MERKAEVCSPPARRQDRPPEHLALCWCLPAPGDGPCLGADVEGYMEHWTSGRCEPEPVP